MLTCTLPHLPPSHFHSESEEKENWAKKSLLTPHFHYFLRIPHLPNIFSYTASNSVNSFLPSSSLFRLKCYFMWICFVDCCVCEKQRREVSLPKRWKAACLHVAIFLSQSFCLKCLIVKKADWQLPCLLPCSWQQPPSPLSPGGGEFAEETLPSPC